MKYGAMSNIRIISQFHRKKGLRIQCVIGVYEVGISSAFQELGLSGVQIFDMGKQGYHRPQTDKH